MMKSINPVTKYIPRLLSLFMLLLLQGGSAFALSYSGNFFSKEDTLKGRYSGRTPASFRAKPVKRDYPPQSEGISHTAISDQINISNQSGLPFAIDSLLVIKDASNHLKSIFELLNELQSGKDTTLTIVHLGDSHIQAGYISGRIMRLLQHQFGNAGRGWIAPFRLSRLNEPDDYFIRSESKDWVGGRITQRAKKTPIGPGGIGIKTLSTAPNLDISIAPKNGAGYEFNRVILYRGDKSAPMLPVGVMKNSVSTSRSAQPLAPRLMVDTFLIAQKTDQLQLQGTRLKPGTNTPQPASAFSNIYYGFSLTNGEPGILYHAVGVNGAMYQNYTDPDFMPRLALLNPDLLIVSLGTNESFGARFREAEFTAQIRSFLSMVKKYMPNTTLLLTTPAECYKRVRVNKKRVYTRNDNIAKAATAIVKLAEQEGIACWDLFSTTGGKDSSKKWFKEGYLSRDRIHFTKEGYQHQADLFFLSWMNWYQSIKNEANNDLE